MVKQTLNNIHYYLLAVFMCFPLLHMKLSNLITVLFFVFNSVSAYYYRDGIQRHSVKDLLIFIAPFSLILISIVFREINPEAIFYVEKSLSLLVLPLGFYLSPYTLSSSQKNRLLSVFVGSSILVVLYGLTISAFRLNLFLEKGVVRSYTEMTSHPAFSHYLRAYFEEAVSLHPTYAGLYLGISFLILFNRMMKHSDILSRRMKNLYIGMGLINLLLLAVLASRAPFAATILGAFVILAAYIKRKIYILWFFAGVVLLSAFLYFMVPSFSARFNEVSKENMELPDAASQNSFNIRAGIYQCSFQIIKENWLFGVGPGKLQERLNQCYSGISNEVYVGHDYNTHNQYLDYWASLGILGPLLLLLLLGRCIYLNLIRGNWLEVSICLLFTICFFTENILLRQYGVVVFSLLFSLFTFTNPQIQKKL